MKKILLTIFAMLVVVPLWAQNQTSTSQPDGANSGPIVREIEVQYAGPQTVTKNVILSNMRTTVGQGFSQTAIEEDIRNLYATGFFTNLRIYDEPLMDGVKVVVIVQGKPTVKEVVVQGFKSLKEKAIRKEIKTKPGSVIDEKQISDDAQKITELYEKKGFPNVAVTYKIDTNEQFGRSTVTYNIDEGGKYVIKQINFDGLKQLDAKTLRKEMKTKKEDWLSWIMGTGKLKKEQFEADLDKLKTYVMNQGFIDFEIKDIQYEYLNDREMNVTLVVFEGIKYKVNSITVEGNELYTTDKVMAKITMPAGATFSPKGNEENIKSIQDLYGIDGYIDTRILPEVQANIQTGMMDVVYKIKEGPQSFVQKVKIEGNTVTKDKVIRRELAVKPGDVYNSVSVDASKARLQNLGYFSKVETYPEETSVPTRKNLVMKVDEQKTGSFTFGAGFSSIDSILGFAELTQGNFDIANWPKFTGGGQKARLRVQYGAQRSDYTLAFVEPWFLDKMLSLSVDAWYRTASYYSTLYNQSTYGFATRLEKPWGQFWRTGVGYRLENINIYNLQTTDPFYLSQAGNYTKSSINANAVYDSRDNVFLTRKGNRTEAFTELAGGPLGGNVQIYKMTVESSQYFEIFKDNIIVLNGGAGAGNFWGAGTQVPIFDRFYLGGANNMRGFAYRAVSPYDSQGNAVGGLSFANFTTEYTFPIIERVRGAVFYDGGFVNSGAWDFSPDDYNSDAGIGLRLNLPIGPIRLDYGYPLQSNQYNKSHGKFQFNVGYQF
ncbi:MAG: outer membrane protein assembly factor BamA [Verrucomicrobiota bacterium]|nr:outer membrane protein assembly factor BamA [Verrucomicrobiota bacterium]